MRDLLFLKHAPTGKSVRTTIMVVNVKISSSSMSMMLIFSAASFSSDCVNLEEMKLVSCIVMM